MRRQGCEWTNGRQPYKELFCLESAGWVSQRGVFSRQKPASFGATLLRLLSFRFSSCTPSPMSCTTLSLVTSYSSTLKTEAASSSTVFVCICLIFSVPFKLHIFNISLIWYIIVLFDCREDVRLLSWCKLYCSGGKRIVNGYHMNIYGAQFWNQMWLLYNYFLIIKSFGTISLRQWVLMSVEGRQGRKLAWKKNWN